MNKRVIKESVLSLLFIAVVAGSLVYGVFSGAKANSLENENIELAEETKTLNADLKSYKGLLLERDIKIQEKDITIQHLSSTNEGLIWQLQEDAE